jgi:hypothetical protein
MKDELPQNIADELPLTSNFCAKPHLRGVGTPGKVANSIPSLNGHFR